MQTIPAGFIPNEWNQTFGAFKRLVEHLAEIQAMLAECREVTAENCDVAYIREQVTNEVDTLQFMASDAETHWKSLGVPVATAAGRFSLNRPADDVAWCSAVLNAAWNLHNGLRRELAGENVKLCVQRLPLHLGRIPTDIQAWRELITAEIRAGALCSEEKPKETPIPDDCVQTIAGVVVLKCELTEESRTSGQWADICDWDAGRKTFGDKAKRGDIRAVLDPNSAKGLPKYFLHRNDIVAFDATTIPLLRSSKIARDAKLKSAKKPGRGGSRKVKP